MISMPLGRALRPIAMILTTVPTGLLAIACGSIFAADRVFVAGYSHATIRDEASGALRIVLQ